MVLKCRLLWPPFVGVLILGMTSELQANEAQQVVVQPQPQDQKIVPLPAITPAITIYGTPTDSQSRKDSVAGKIIIGRKSIEKSGATNVVDVLRREPAVTVTGDGRLGLLGMPGHTQILIDGMPPSAGKSPAELDVVHVERIEIVKSSLAEFGPYGVAGTINIVSRKAVRKASTQFRMGATGSSASHGMNFSLSENRSEVGNPISLAAQISGSWQEKSDESNMILIALPNGQSGTERQRTKILTSGNTVRMLASGTLTWKANSSHKFEVDPSVLYLKVGTFTDEQHLWMSSLSGPNTAYQRGWSPFTSVSVPLKWTFNLGSDSQLLVRLSPTRYVVKNDSERMDEFPGALNIDRNANLRTDNNVNFLKIDYSTNLAKKHDVKVGAAVGRTSSETEFANFIMGTPDTTFDALGNNRVLFDQKASVFVQDDWRISNALGLNLGLSGERRSVDIQDGPYYAQLNYHIWSPSVHFAWKIDGDSKRQVRVSLARAFNAPFLDQLSLRPTIHPLAPCRANGQCVMNSAEYADTSGNPHLHPVKSTGINISYEFYIGEESLLTLEAFSRELRDTIVNDIRLQAVAWSQIPRYVAQPTNLGAAWARGLNLEAQIQLREFWPAAPKADLHGSISLARSRVSTLPEPDNRMADQTPWRAKLGGTYPLSNYPIRFSADIGWTPAGWVRTNVTRRLFNGHQTDLSAQAAWTVNPNLRISLSLDNLLAKERRTVEEFYSSQDPIQRRTLKPLHPKLGISMDLKL